MTARKAIQLQAKLNAIFVAKRDAGLSTTHIYIQLQIVERYLNSHGIRW